MQKKYRLIVGLLIVVIFGGVFAFIGIKNYLVKRHLASFTPPPLPVTTHRVELQSWAQHIDVVGTLKAVRGVDLSPATAGHVRSIPAAQGTLVSAGAVVIQLDDEVEQAELRSLSAQLFAAELESKRARELVKKSLLSKMQGDQLESRYNDLLARKERVEALIERRRIRAPFTGQLGIHHADIGQYVKEGEALVALQALDQLYVDFYVPEQATALMRKEQRVRCTVDAVPDETFAGRIVSVDTKVQADTHNLMVRAVLDNSARRLLPGMFARVDVTQENTAPVLTVPQESISYSLYGNAVFLVENSSAEKNDAVVKRQYVELGEQRDNQVVVAKGLRAGDVVVASGMMDLRTGTHVKVVSGTD